MSDWSQVDFSRFKVRTEGSERARKKREDELERERIRASGELPGLREKITSIGRNFAGEAQNIVAAAPATGAARLLEGAQAATYLATPPTGNEPRVPLEAVPQGGAPPGLYGLAKAPSDQMAMGYRVAPHEWAENAIGVLDAYAEETQETSARGDPRLEGSFWFDQVPRGAASVAAIASSGGAAGALGGSAEATGAIMGSLAEAGGTYMEAKARLAAKVARGEITPEEARVRAWGAWALGLPLGYTDQLSVGGIMGRVDKAMGGLLGDAATKIALGAAGEFAQEAGQGVGENIVQRWITGDDVSLLEGVKEQGLAGGVVGGALAAMLGLGHAIGNRRAQEAQGVPRGTEGAPTEQAPALPQAAMPGEPVAPEPGPASSYGPELVPGVGVPGVERVGQAAETEIPPEVRAAAQQHPAVQGFVQSMEAASEARGVPLAPEQSQEVLASAKPAQGEAAELARRFGTQAFTVRSPEGSPLPAEGYMAHDGTIILDESLDEKTARRQVLWHEIAHLGRKLVGPEWASLRDELERDFPDLMDQWRVQQETAQAKAGRDRDSVVKAAMERGLSKEQAEAHYADLIREESVSQAAEEAAGFITWALSDRSRLEKLLTQARKGDRPTFMQRLLDLFRRAFHAAGIGKGTAQQQLDLLARTISAGQWESMNPRDAAELAGRFVKLADAMTAAATKPAAQVAPAEVSSPQQERRTAAQPVAQERRQRPYTYAQALSEDVAAGRAETEAAVSQMEREAEGLPEEVTGGTFQEQAGVAQMPTEPGLFGPVEREGKQPDDQGGPTGQQLNLLDVQEGDLPGQTSILDEPKGRPHNPFREKATRARELADRLNKPTAHEAGMAQAFPLGAGFGRGSERSRNRKMDASITRATKAVEAENNARYLEAQADAFDRGEINAQGRRWSKRQEARSNKRAAAKESREQRIAEAKARIEGKQRWEVSGEDWATAHGYLGGFDRKQILSEHAEIVEQHKPAPIPESIQAVAETMKRRRSTKALRFLDALRTITGTPAEADIRLEDVSVADLRKAIYTADPNGPRNRSGVDLRRRASEFLQRAYLDTADALEAKPEQKGGYQVVEFSQHPDKKGERPTGEVYPTIKQAKAAWARALEKDLARADDDYAARHFDQYARNIGGVAVRKVQGEREAASAQRSKAAAERLAGRRQRVADGLEGDFRSFVRAMGGLANPEGHFDAYTSKEQGRKGGLFGGSPIAFPKGSNKGSSYEQIRDAAVEVGYFPGLGMRDVGLQDILDALDSNPVAPGKLGEAADLEAERHYQSELAAEQAYYDALSPEERAAADKFLEERARQAEEGIPFEDRFSPAKGDPVDPRGGPWFSAVSRVVAKMPQPKMSGEQARAWIGKQPGVTAEELDYLGLPDYLASKPAVTQQDLLEFVDAHQVRVEETLYANMPSAKAPPRWVQRNYNLPGGQNHAELLLTWNPPSGLTPKQTEENRAALAAILEEKRPLTERLEKLNQERVQLESGEPTRPVPPLVTEEFRSATSDGADIRFEDQWRHGAIAQIRPAREEAGWTVYSALFRNVIGGPIAKLDDAVAFARSVHSPEELRKLWVMDELTHVNDAINVVLSEIGKLDARAADEMPHREPPRPVYASHAFPEKNILAWLRTDDRVTAQGEPTLFVEEVQSDWHQAGRDSGYQSAERARRLKALNDEHARIMAARNQQDSAELTARLLEVVDEMNALHDAESRDAVPDAPFKQTWGSLALKRAIKWAVDHGKTAIAWTTGTQQADRWNQQLHEHVRRISWNASEIDGLPAVHVQAWTAEADETDPPDWGGMFNPETGEEHGNHTQAQLSSYVGANLAQRIRSDALEGRDGEASGLDLTIGAEGFRYFYDQALPQAANKLGKRYGAKVEPVLIEGGGRDGRTGVLTAHGFRIPPAMAETIKAEGFSTFADKFSPRPDEERAIGPTPLGGSFADREEGFWQRLNRRVMYEFAPVARAQAGVLAEGGTVTPESDVAKKQTLYESKRAEDVRAIRQEQRKLVRILKRAGIKLDEFDDYLRALHAPRRNDLMAERHPGAFNPLYNPGAGSTTRGARLTPNVIRDILSTVEADPRAAAFKQGAALVHAVNEAALQQRVDRGLLSREGAETWREQFGPEYVPLRSAELESQDGLPFVQGTGFQVPKRLSKRAEGRRTASGSPTVWSFAQAEEVASWARRNEVGLSMASLVRANPIPGLWRVSDTPTTQDGKPVEASDGKVQAFRFKERGDDRYIVFEGPTGVQLAETLKRLGVEKTGSLVKYLGGVGRVFTRLATQWNPEFLLRNLVKDVPTALIRTVAVQGWKAGARTGASIPMAIRGIRQVLQAETAGKEPPHGYWQDRFVEFRKAGGKTGYTSLQDYQSRAEDFGKALKRGNVAELARTVWAAYENLQEAVEAGTRLAVYDTSLRHGMSQEDAAIQAREVTVDFNRKGELTPVLNSLYWFFNPSVQGSRMVLKTLGTPRGAALGGAVAALGYILANFNRWIGQDDDDKRNRWDETSDWLKNGYLQVLLPGMVDVPLPGGRKLSIDRVMAPLPWGYSMLFSAGLHAAETQARAEDPTAALGHVMAAATESFNPMGASPTPAQFVSPSLIDPFVQLTENRSFTGSAIRPENPYGQKAPSEVYWPDVNESARELTHWLNQITGGNKREAGRISISPEDLEHLVQSYTGGGGQFLERAFKAAQNIAAGGEVETREVPFLRSFAAEPDERTMQSQYRRAVNRVRTTDQVQRLDQGAPQRPELLELVQTAKEYEKEIEGLEEAGLTEQANARRREFLKLYRSTLSPEPAR